jgi:hypothetical protein
LCQLFTSSSAACSIRVAVGNTQPVEPTTPPFRSVAFMLTSLGYTISRRFQQVLEPLELEPGEFALMRAVSAREGDELENRGLVERTHHPRDRRVRNLHLTAVGKRLLRRAEQCGTFRSGGNRPVERG